MAGRHAVQNTQSLVHEGGWKGPGGGERQSTVWDAWSRTGVDSSGARKPPGGFEFDFATQRPPPIERLPEGAAQDRKILGGYYHFSERNFGETIWGKGV